jgi:hypothetical protein
MTYEQQVVMGEQPLTSVMGGAEGSALWSACTREAGAEGGVAGATGSGSVLGGATSGTGSSLISTGPPSLLAWTVAFTDVGVGAMPFATGLAGACACRCTLVMSGITLISA